MLLSLIILLIYSWLYGFSDGVRDGFSLITVIAVIEHTTVHKTKNNILMNLNYFYYICNEKICNA